MMLTTITLDRITGSPGGLVVARTGDTLTAFAGHWQHLASSTDTGTRELAAIVGAITDAEPVPISTPPACVAGWLHLLGIGAPTRCYRCSAPGAVVFLAVVAEFG